MADDKRPTLAVGGVVFRERQVLLIQRRRPPFKGHWSIPGGKVEFREPLEAALRREILEETAIDTEPLGLIDVFEALPATPTDRHFVMVDYACRAVGGTVAAGDDAMDAAFFSLDEAMARLAWDKTRQAIQGALRFVDR